MSNYLEDRLTFGKVLNIDFSLLTGDVQDLIKLFNKELELCKKKYGELFNGVYLEEHWWGYEDMSLELKCYYFESEDDYVVRIKLEQLELEKSIMKARLAKELKLHNETIKGQIELLKKQMK